MFLPKNFNSVENGHDQFLKKKKKLHKCPSGLPQNWSQRLKIAPQQIPKPKPEPVQQTGANSSSPRGRAKGRLALGFV
jgi:hypothetical protein